MLASLFAECTRAIRLAKVAHDAGGKPGPVRHHLRSARKSLDAIEVEMKSQQSDQELSWRPMLVEIRVQIAALEAHPDDLTTKRW